MENILILDTETTGLDANKEKILEIAAVYYNVKNRAIVHQVSTLLYAESNDAYHINNIHVDLVKSVSEFNQTYSLALIRVLMNNCDAIVAHNAKFDRNFIENFEFLTEPSKSKHWICSKDDIKWPITGSLKLTEISVSMGVPVISAHRALPDCIMLTQCLGKLTDLEEQLNATKVEKNIYTAKLSFHQRHLAKEAGFSWNSIIPNCWAKRLTEEQARKLQFPVELV